MSNHSSGPWRIRARGKELNSYNESVWLAPLSDPKKIVCVLATDTPKGQANLQLVLASPLMFDAPKMIRARLVNDTGRDWRRELDAIDRAMPRVVAPVADEVAAKK